jgi:hypothetical protein
MVQRELWSMRYHRTEEVPTMAVPNPAVMAPV